MWWHLSVAIGFCDIGKCPTLYPFTYSVRSTVVAYSWGFELILSRVYAWFGLSGFAFFGVLLSLLVSVALFATCYALSGRFWRSWFLTLFGSLAYIYSIFPVQCFSV